MQRLKEKGVRIITSCEVKEILDNGILITVCDGREEVVDNLDHVVLALGTKAVDNLYGIAKAEEREIHLIGDARSPRKILEAIAEGAEVGRVI
jgi:hypothetical protein